MFYALLITLLSPIGKPLDIHIQPLAFATRAACFNAMAEASHVRDDGSMLTYSCKEIRS